MKHGTATMYLHGACRCDKCRKWYDKALLAARRQGRPRKADQ